MISGHKDHEGVHPLSLLFSAEAPTQVSRLGGRGGILPAALGLVF